MATIQLTFNLRTSPNCKTVHLLGNWDGYKSQLPLSKESSKSGAWKGTFRFNGTLQQGQRYWYYYIIDGYSVTHDPAQPSTVEPTTQRALNILDIPAASGKPALSVNTAANKRASRRESANVAHGRSLSPSKIVSPKPHKPHEARRLANKRYSGRDIDALSEQLSRTQVSASSFSSDDEDSEEDSDIDSDACSDIPSLSSGSSTRGSPASSLVSPVSPASACSCDRFGLNKAGARVRLDCGGSRCGSEIDSASSDSEGEVYRTKLVARSGAEKRHGIAVRHSRR